MKTPSEWAVECGQTVPVMNPGMMGQTLYTGAHGGADALHGWSKHAYDYGAEPTMTKDDYELALLAAMHCTGNIHVPHPGAIPTKD